MLFDIVYTIYVYLVLSSDFCEKHDHECSRDSVCKRRDDSVCEPPKGDNGARTGLVVGSLLSSVLVLLVWIVPVLLHSRGVIINKYVLSVHTHIYVPAELHVPQ